jgi:aquaporin related protein
MFLTAQLVFTIFMLATEKHEGTFIAPIGIGLSLFVAELMGVFYTGGSVNPARSFGPAVVTHSFHSYHWIYWLGPVLGAILASAFYMFIKALEYETVNSQADSEKTFSDKFTVSAAGQKNDGANVRSDSGIADDAAMHASPVDGFVHAPHMESGYADRQQRDSNAGVRMS